MNRAKEAAIKDIREELKQECKVFIAFKTELNPAIRKIVNYYSKAQITAYGKTKI